MGQEHLTAALVKALQADTGLVLLTKHTTTNIRIGKDMPPVAERTPYVGVKVVTSPPLIPDTVTQLQNARIQFKAVSKEDLTATKVADRLEALFHAASKASNLGYWDASDGTVRFRSFRYVNRQGPEYDVELKVFTVTVEASCIWLDQAC